MHRQNWLAERVKPGPSSNYLGVCLETRGEFWNPMIASSNALVDDLSGFDSHHLHQKDFEKF